MYAMSTRQGLLAGRSTDRVGDLYIPRLPTGWKWKLITKKAFLKRDCSTLKLIQTKYFIPIRNYFVQGVSFPSHSLLMGCFFPFQSQSKDYKRPGYRNFGHLTFFFFFFGEFNPDKQ